MARSRRLPLDQSLRMRLLQQLAPQIAPQLDPTAGGLMSGAAAPSLWSDDPLPPHLAGGRPTVASPPHLSPVTVPDRAPAAPAQRQTIGSRVADGVGLLFGGAPDPSLTPEQNHQARSAALVSAGLRMVLASSEGDMPFAAALAAGALGGQETGAIERERFGLQNTAKRKAEQEAELKRGMELLGAGGAGLPELHMMFQESVISGNVEMAKALGTVIQSVEAAQSKKEDYGADWTQGEGLNPLGKPEKYRMHRVTGEVIWTGIAPIPTGSASSSSGPSEQQLFTRENTLVNDFQAQIKPYQDTLYTIEGTLQNVPLAKAGDGAAQNELVVTFVRALDPTSVAREGEVSLARQSASIWDQVQGFHAKYIKGEGYVLPPALIDQMALLIEKRADSYAARWEEERQRAAGRAARWGVDEGVFPQAPRRSRVTAPLEPVEDALTPFFEDHLGLFGAP